MRPLRSAQAVGTKWSRHTGQLQYKITLQVYTKLDTQHPLKSGTDTHVGPEVPVQTPRPLPTSDFLSLPSFPQWFILKKFVARIELFLVPKSRHWGASGRCQGLLHLLRDTPRNLCPKSVQNRLDLAGVLCGPVITGGVLSVFLRESERLGLWVPAYCTLYVSEFLCHFTLCICVTLEFLPIPDEYLPLCLYL